MSKSLDNNKRMAPLWLMYPYIGRYSIGWRMGMGESYKYEFGDWFSALSIEDQNNYHEMFPEPKGWLGWYEEDHLDEDCYDNEGDLLWNVEGKPVYSMNWIREKVKSGEELQYLFFWGHQPSSNGHITTSCLSQWWKEQFVIETHTYCCMEQYMMAEKATVFDDKDMLERILNSDNPKEIKALGRKVTNFDEAKWISKRNSIVLNGNYAKFLQNPKLMQFLLQTENKILVEASPYDNIWGIGMSSDHNSVNDPLEWKGQNLLGFALMEVRDELRRISKHYSELNINELHEEEIKMDNDLLEQLTLWHNENKYKKIITTIKKIPEADRDYDLVCHLGRALNNQGEYSEAINCFLSVQEQGEHDSLWHFRIGYAYYYLKQYKGAIVAFEQCVALDPKDSQASMFLKMSLNADNSAGNETTPIMNVKKEMRYDPRLSEVNEKIDPFMLVIHSDESLSMILNVGTYKHELFQTRAEEGFEGSGYDWASLATVFLAELMPHFVDVIRFDPEGSMFAAYTDNRDSMFSFAIAFKDACEDDTLIKDLFSRAILD